MLPRSHCWRVFDDTVPTLTALGDRGWRHVVVSNHVPELERLVADLGLARHLDAVVTSAQVGFEKPHPAIFDHALAVVGRPEVVWMVGDNPTADVGGAEALGIPAILVRREGGAERCAPSLVEAARLILDGDG